MAHTGVNKQGTFSGYRNRKNRNSVIDFQFISGSSHKHILQTDLQITTTPTTSTLTIAKLKLEFGGEYMCRITNVAGTQESMASLAVVQPSELGKAPDFKQRMNDVRSQQNAASQFVCVVSGSPEPTTSWFKVNFTPYS